MMKHFRISSIALVIAGGLLAASCESYDDSALQSRVKNLEDKYAALESKCQTLNDNVTAIQTAVSKIGSSVYVSSVVPGEGFVTINFSDGTSATIKDGKDGQDGVGEKGDKGDPGAAPVISVKADTDGVFYWTANGEWILDSGGKKVPVDSGKAVSPKFKVEEGWWWISVYGDGNWEKIEGSQTGDAITVSETEDAVYLTIGGNMITLPKAAGTGFKIVLEKYGSQNIAAGGTFEVNYTITKGDESTVVVTECSGYTAEVIPNGNDKGKVVITAPSVIPTSGYVIVKAVKNSSAEISAQIVTFEAGILNLLAAAVEVGEDGGDVEFKVSSNVNWTVSIPEEASSWITAWNTKALTETTVVLTVARNKGAARTAAITVSDTDGLSLSRTIVVNQAKSSVETVEISAAADAKKIFYSDAVITWTDVEGIENYNILLDSVKVATVAAGVQTYKLTGLSCDKDYVVNVAVDENKKEGISGNIAIHTKAIRKNTDNVGPTHLSFSLDDISGGSTSATASTPNNRGYHYQLSTTKDESGCVYNIYGFDGSASIAGSPYSTSSWLGKSSNKNLAIPVAISFGDLKANTTYYFRAKTEEVTMKSYFDNKTSDVTIKATNGESEWSEWIEASTEPAHVPAANEVIYGGFDALSISIDLVNESCGTYPYVEGMAMNKATETDLRADLKYPWTGEWRVCMFANPIKVCGWNFADEAVYLDGSETVGTIRNLKFNQYAGDMQGWFCSDDFCPGMGVLFNRTGTLEGHFVATPALNSALLSSTPKTCTLKFKACMAVTAYISTNQDLNIKVCRDNNLIDATTVSIPNNIYKPEAPTTQNCQVDYKFTEFSVDVDLKAGDSVMIAGASGTRFAIDDIQILVK